MLHKTATVYSHLAFKDMKITVKIELIARCLSNDREGQRELYDMLLPYLNLICKRYLHQQADLKDVLQNTFISIFKNLQQFDTQKASFKTWSTKIAINYCLQQNAKNKRDNIQEFVIGLHDSRISPTILDQLSNEELVRWLKKMPSTYLEVFQLYAIDGFSHPEIAELLGINEALSRQRFSRGRAWLKKKLPRDNRLALNFN